jgi:DNA-binding CsgD family transcriptional regulator
VSAAAALNRLSTGPARLLVVARGGHGKTRFARAAAAALEQRSVPVTVVRGRSGMPLPAAETVTGALIVDDAHLLDPGEAAALAAMWSIAAARRLRLVVTRRTAGVATPFAAALAGLEDDLDPARERLDLGFLGADGASALALEVGGAGAGGSDLADFAGGNPRWVERLALAGWAPDGPVPGPVIEAVSATLAALRPEALEVAVALAGFGGAGGDGRFLAGLDGAGDLDDAGLVDPAGRLAPVVAAAVAASIPAERRQLALAALARRPLGAAARAELHRQLDRRDAEAAAAFGDAAARCDDAAAALRWHQEALRCTGTADQLRDRTGQAAEAAWRSGRHDLLGPLADAAERHDLAAVALCAAGQPAAAADRLALLPSPQARLDRAVLRALAGDPTPLVDLSEREERGGGEGPGPDIGMGLASATRVLCGLATLASGVNGHALDAGLAELLAAASLAENATPRPLPDSPHAQTALAATALGRADLAEVVLGRAQAGEVGGPWLAARHRLLLGWALLRAGRVASAARVADELASSTLSDRDRLVQLALHAGLARRAGSLERQHAAWLEAERLLLRLPLDVTAVELLSELAPAGSKLSGPGVDAALARVARTVACGGRAPATARGEAPPFGDARFGEGAFGGGAFEGGAAGGAPHCGLWAAHLAWAGFLGAVWSGRAAPAPAWAARVVALAPVGTAVAARGAAAVIWAEVITGQPREGAVAEATDLLAGAGAVWEASQLASHAAVRSSDQATARALLDLARRYRSELEWGEASATPDQVPAKGPAAALGFELTPRQREVAVLLLEGRSYREMSEMLFTSVKTLERHVTDIRAKAGATDRATLFSQLRAYLGETRRP